MSHADIVEILERIERLEGVVASLEKRLAVWNLIGSAVPLALLSILVLLLRALHLF